MLKSVNIFRVAECRISIWHYAHKDFFIKNRKFIRPIKKCTPFLSVLDGMDKNSKQKKSITLQKLNLGLPALKIWVPL